MTDLKDSIIDSIKSLLLPEIRKLQEIANEFRIRQDAVEKQMVIMNQTMVIMNQNILDNSRRIDETNKKIDDMGARLNQRIDTMGARLDLRIDYTHIELGNIKKEMERLRREDAVTSDILHRLEIVEERVLLGR